MKKTIATLLAAALSLSLLAGCGGDQQETPTPSAQTQAEKTVLKVGASPTPHAEILEVVTEALAQENIDLQIVEFDDYIIPNTALEEGELDANYFQHITYLNNFNDEHGTHLSSVGVIHYEPIGIYAGKTASLAELPDGAVIAVPNDPTNETRALLLLEQEGLITLKERAGIDATKDDIASNPHNYKIQELKAENISSTLPDVDVAVINGNYAIDAGLKVSEALAIESAEGEATQAYGNIIAVKEGNEDNAAVQALVNGQVDAVVIDNAPAQEYVKANPGLKILDTEFTNEDYAIGVAKGNTALLDAINGALAELTADGTLQAIVDKYIPAE